MPAAEFPNPPVLSSAPADGQVAIYQASTNTWIPATITAAQIAVPQTGAALPALTSSQNATAAAATQTGSYVQADVQSIRTLANALQVSYNAAQVDIAALSAAVEALEDMLEAAGILTVT